MTTLKFKDLFSGHAADYKNFRPEYPGELFQYLASLAPARELAWDCATGNGQAARALKNWFRAVVATDASAQQLSRAEPTEGIQYRVAPAEQSGIAASSVDLVTVAQALHWFDRERFFAEAQRVLRPGGIVACWCYGLMHVSPGVDALVYRLYEDILGTYWPPERMLVQERYQTIDFPFAEVAAPRFEITEQWDFAQVVGYLGTWSSARLYRKRHGTDPIELIGDELLAAWGDPATARPVVWPLHARIGRKVPIATPR